MKTQVCVCVSARARACVCAYYDCMLVHVFYDCVCVCVRMHYVFMYVCVYACVDIAVLSLKEINVVYFTGITLNLPSDYIRSISAYMEITRKEMSAVVYIHSIVQ